MTELSPVRMWIMRAMYLFMAVGIAGLFWPLIINHSPETAHMTGVAWALIGTIGLLALLGLRYPVQMIPILVFELTWKVIWLVAFALPAWLEGTLTDAMRTSIFETSFGLILLFVIPWRYVFFKYVAKPGEPLRFRRDTARTGAQRA